MIPPRGPALVTGGARRIGATIVQELARAGYPVVIHFNRSGADAASVADAIRADGGQAATIPGDLARLHDIETLFARACAPFGPPRLLVNNASTFLPDRASDIEPDRFSLNIAVNLQAPVLLSRCLADSLPHDSTGAIVNIIDQRVLRPDPRYLSYTLAKAALHVATRTLAQSLAPSIRVNAIGPGPTLANSEDGETGLAREVAATLLGRKIVPEEIARAVLFLAEAESVTGQMIAVDSGQHLGWRTPDIIA